MKKVIVKSMHLLNFKGIRDLPIEFADGMTSVYGRNGTGKTTIFDAFTWVLFGKDSQDRKSFDIKTLDGDNRPIPRLPHEVSITLMVDNQTVNLTRRYNEKWTKKRGSAEEEFCGHEEERLYNDVPCSVRDWNEKIADICSEEDFKLLTSPSYFVSQKWDKQRKRLFEMAGNITPEDIAKGNPAFTSLLGQLDGKTLEEYVREIQAKKRRIKSDIDGLPDRIDERRRDLSAYEINFAAVEQEIAEKKSALAGIDKQLADAAERYNASNRESMALAKKLGDAKIALANRQYQIKRDANAAYNASIAECIQHKTRIENLQSRIATEASKIGSIDSEAIQAAEQRQRLLAEYKSIQAETLEFRTDEFVCPTCGRPLEVADLEAKQSEMKAKFNARKSAALANNISRGKAHNAVIADIQNRKVSAEAQLEELQKQLDTLLKQPAPKMIEATDDATLRKLYDSDKECKKLQDKLAELQSIKLPEKGAQDDTSELNDAKAVLIEATEELNKQLALKELAAKNHQRIAELEEQLRTEAQELADLERIEATIAEFSKAKIESVEGKINSMFSTVRFKMYEKQINGGESETCEAVVNGVPYSSLNNAAQINAGIDIINAFSEWKGISAPVFIDNAEAVINLLPTQSQVVRLVVSDCDLTIDRNINQINN